MGPERHECCTTDAYSFEPEGSHYDCGHDGSLSRNRRDVSVPFSAPPPEHAGAFFGALFATGYMLPLVMDTQLLVGTLLLVNRFVPLALAIIAPIVINVIAFHVVLAPSSLPLALVVVVLEMVLAWSYRGAFRSMLEPRASSQGTARA